MGVVPSALPRQSVARVLDRWRTADGVLGLRAGAELEKTDSKETGVPALQRSVERRYRNTVQCGGKSCEGRRRVGPCLRRGRLAHAATAIQAQSRSEEARVSAPQYIGRFLTSTGPGCAARPARNCSCRPGTSFQRSIGLRFRFVLVPLCCPHPKTLPGA